MAMLPAGTIVEGRYRVERLLGEGGFGRVYRAFDDRLGQTVALKEFFDNDPEFVAQIQFEVRLLSGLRHPALPTVSDFFTQHGRPWMVMSYVPGLSLREELDEGPAQRFTEADARAIAAELLSALIFLHGLNPPIVHRDLKPANVRRTPSGQIVLVDFGLAKPYQPNQQTTRAAQAVTPGFSPIEQYGSGITDPRSDLYALGATLYNLVTGIEPPDSVHLASGTALTPPRSLAPGLSVEFERFILRLMELQAGARYQSAQIALDALQGAAAVVAPPLGSQVAARSGGAVGPPCPSCGTPNLPGTPFCDQCGFQLNPLGGAASPAVRAATPAVAPAAQVIGPPCSSCRTPNPPGSPFCRSCGLQLSAAPAPPQQPRAQPPRGRAVGPPPLFGGWRPNPLTLMMVLISAVLLGMLGLLFSDSPSVGPPPRQAAETAAALSAEQLIVLSEQRGELQPLAESVRPAYANLIASDFVVNASFVNPVSSSAFSWDYGFFFRHTESGEQYRLIVQGNGTWSLDLWTDGESRTITSGFLANLNVNADEINALQLVASGPTGYFFLNNEFIGELDLSDKLLPGDIGVAVATYDGNEQNGLPTPYFGFQIGLIGPNAVVEATAIAQLTRTPVANLGAPTAMPTASGGGGLLGDLELANPTAIPVVATALASGEAFVANLPSAGELAHLTDGNVSLVDLAVNTRDFILSVSFENPYDAASGPWDYGVFFRDTGGNRQYRLVVESSGVWDLRLREDEEARAQQSGALPSLRRAASERNELRVVVFGGEGAFFLNGQFIAELNLSDKLTAGDVGIATAINSGNERAGAITRYHDLNLILLGEAASAAQQQATALAALPATPEPVALAETALAADLLLAEQAPLVGPQSGELRHEGDDAAIESLSFDLNQRDLMVDLSFVNPYDASSGDWDYGLIVRETADLEYRLILRSGQTWELRLRPTGQSSRLIASGALPQLLVAAGESNQLQLWMQGASGLLRVNGEVIATLDLSAHLAAGDLQVVTGFFDDAERDGTSTGYRNLRIWELLP